MITCVTRKPESFYVLPRAPLPPVELPSVEMTPFRLTRQIDAVARGARADRERLRREGASTEELLVLDRRTAVRLDALERREALAYAALEQRLASRLAAAPTTTGDERAELLYAQARVTFHLANAAYLHAVTRHERQLERLERLGLPAAPEPPAQDYKATLRLLGRLAMQFPAHRHLDAVLYLQGYCRGEMGRSEAASRAFLSLVCASRPRRGAGPRGEELRGAGAYDGCAPLRVGSRYAVEAWIRIGERHFEEGQLDEAISAYEQVVRAGPLSGALLIPALYKQAWSHYRADRFAAAVRGFDRVATLPRGGPYDMRSEAVQYLAISLAEEDWDGDERPDPETPLQRIERLYLGRWLEPHVFEVYRDLGNVLFDSARYGQAAEVYHVTVGRWPRRSREAGLEQRQLESRRRYRRR